MWLVSLGLSFAQAQTIELNPRDMGTTLSLEAGQAYRVDLGIPQLDLDRVSLVTPDGETTFGRLYDEAYADGAEVTDLMVVSLGDRDELRIAFIDPGVRGGIRTCRPLYEYRCIGSWGQVYCQWVLIGSTCCADGTTSCGDYILLPE